MARKEHKKHVRELLAQAIVHKTLDMERARQVAIKRKLEEIAKIELVRRVQVKQHSSKLDFYISNLFIFHCRRKLIHIIINCINCM